MLFHALTRKLFSLVPKPDWELGPNPSPIRPRLCVASGHLLHFHLIDVEVLH